MAAPYFALVYWCTTLIDAGYPKALYLVVLVCICSALKFLIAGIVSFIRLASKSVLEPRPGQQGYRDSERGSCQSHSSEK